MCLLVPDLFPDLFGFFGQGEAAEPRAKLENVRLEPLMDRDACQAAFRCQRCLRSRLLRCGKIKCNITTWSALAFVVFRAHPPRRRPDHPIEADVASLDGDEEKSDLIDGSLGEGWRDRLVKLDNPSTYPGRGLCLEPHDCVLSKMVAGRQKDYDFATALLDISKR